MFAYVTERKDGELIMIHLKDGIKIIAIDNSYSDNDNDMYSIYLNTRNSLIVPKDFLSVFFLFNGLLERNQIIELMSLRWGLKKSEKCLNEISEWGVLEEVDVTDYSNRNDIQVFHSKLKGRMVIIDDLSSIAFSVAVVLSQFGVKNIGFSEPDRVIGNLDFKNNIFIKKADIGKKFSDILIANGIESSFDQMVPEYLDADSVLVRFQERTKTNDESGLLLNAYDYKNIKNFGFDLVQEKMDISEDIEAAIDEYVWAIRICEDLFYSVGNGIYN